MQLHLTCPGERTLIGLNIETTKKHQVSTKNDEIQPVCNLHPTLCHDYVPLAKWSCSLPKCVWPFSEFIYYTTCLYHHIRTLLFLTQFIYICFKIVINKSLKTLKLSHWKLLAHLHFLVLKSGPREFGTERHCSRIKVRCTSYSCSDILSTSSNDGLKRILLCISC